MREFTLKERPLLKVNVGPAHRRAIIVPWQVRPSSPLTLKYGATRNFVVGLGRAFSGSARTHSSRPLTRHTSGGCGNRLPFRVRVSSAVERKNIVRCAAGVHQAMASAVRTSTFSGRTSTGMRAPRP
jgi:hypothetical protein